MEKNSVIVNIGSASKKYALYRGGKEILRAHFEHEGEKSLVTIQGERKSIRKIDFEESFAYMLEQFGSIHAIGIRIVAPGEYFLEHRIIDDEYVKHLEEAAESAPLHIRPTLDELKKIFAHDLNVPVVGISDSVFHKDLPLVARTYAIDKEDSESLGIRRYGYHGISLASIVGKLSREGLPDRVIVCHLGGGASITAIKHGKSADTSMGYTPLEGLVMATRAGDIDAGALIALAKKKQFSHGELESYLNHSSGLLGISGTSNDIRILLEREAAGDKDAALALAVYVEKIKKYIGAYVAVLGGLDMLVFAGTVGERSSIIRERVCHGLGTFDILLDQENNTTLSLGEGAIQSPDARVQVLVVKTDEMQEIFEEMSKLV